MKHAIVPLAVLLILTAVLFAGCASSEAPKAPVTTAAPVETPPPATPVVTATAAPTIADGGPIEAIPSAQQINLELTKDRPTSEIHLLYQGGAGIMFTSKIVMRVYDSAGASKEYIMSDGKRPAAGDEIIAKGTRGGDRCVVFVTSAGTTYKVIDKYVYGDL